MNAKRLLFAMLEPTGPCARAIDALARRLEDVTGKVVVCGQSGPLHPHVSVHSMPYDTDREKLWAVLRDLCTRSAPIELRIGTIGYFPAPDQTIFVEIEKTPELVRFFNELKAALDAIGASAYQFTVEQWRPHLTLAYGQNLSPREFADLLNRIQQMRLPICDSPATELLVAQCVDELNNGADHLATFPFLGKA